MARTKLSALVGTADLDDEPQPAAAPAATTPAPARKAPTRRAGNKYPPKVSFYQDPDDTDRVRGAILHTMAAEGPRSLSQFINKAVMTEVERLERKYNNGQPFPAVGAELPQGRPMGSRDGYQRGTSTGRGRQRARRARPTLAHSTRNVPVPADSYRLLAELRATVNDLEQVCQQLSGWHGRVVDGTHYAGEDARGDGATGTITASAELEVAAVALSRASAALGAAHSANGVVRWFDTPR